MRDKIIKNETTQDATELKNQIKFNAAKNGFVDICRGQTVFSDLFVIGALSLTKKYGIESVCNEYETDTEGLKTLGIKTNEAIDLISDAVATLGILMVYAEEKELSESNIANYGWLVAGLGELLSELGRISADVSYSLRQSEDRAS